MTGINSVIKAKFVKHAKFPKRRLNNIKFFFWGRNFFLRHPSYLRLTKQLENSYSHQNFGGYQVAKTSVTALHTFCGKISKSSANISFIALSVLLKPIHCNYFKALLWSMNIELQNHCGRIFFNKLRKEPKTYLALIKPLLF